MHRRGHIRLNRLSSDPQPATTSPTILCKPSQSANRHFPANTPFNSAPPPTTNPFDQRTHPKKVATVEDVKQATITPLMPSSVSLPPAPLNPRLQAPALPTLQPPAPPILHPGWEQGGSVPNLAAGPKSKVTAAYGWKGRQSKNSPAPRLHQPKLEPVQEPMPLTGSLSQQLEQIIDQKGVVDESGVSPPRLNLSSALSVRLDATHAPLIMPLPTGQFVDPSAKTPPLAEQPNMELGMVVCPLCPVPGYVLRNDLDHARNMHR